VGLLLKGGEVREARGSGDVEKGKSTEGEGEESQEGKRGLP